MSFLPTDYSIPAKDSSYMKFIEGKNQFRVLDSAIVGFELWVGGKPVRRKGANEFTSNQLANADTNTFTGKKKTPQYFWAFPVFNYQTEKVEILEVRQVTIMRGMEDYLRDDDYGKDPKKYDFVVVRDEAGEKVEYRVNVKPPKELDEGILKLYKDLNINLNALFTGADPFAGEKLDVDEIDEKLKVFSKK